MFTHEWYHGCYWCVGRPRLTFLRAEKTRAGYTETWGCKQCDRTFEFLRTDPDEIALHDQRQEYLGAYIAARELELLEDGWTIDEAKENTAWAKKMLDYVEELLGITPPTPGQAATHSPT